MIDLGVNEDAEVANAASDEAIESVTSGGLPDGKVAPETESRRIG
jgi:hypothetical protein